MVSMGLSVGGIAFLVTASGQYREQTGDYGSGKLARGCKWVNARHTRCLCGPSHAITLAFGVLGPKRVAVISTYDLDIVIIYALSHQGTTERGENSPLNEETCTIKE